MTNLRKKNKHLGAALSVLLVVIGLAVAAIILGTPGRTVADLASFGLDSSNDSLRSSDYVRTRLAGASATPTVSRISVENALPGTDEWANIGNYNINSLSAFPGATSVNAGNPIGIHVKSTGTSLSARLYRLGYYQDHGARLIATYSGIQTPSQPNCTRLSSTGLVRCPWSSTFTINTDPGWISGIFLLRLDSNNGFRFFVYFVVRNDGYNSDILVMEPSKTNQAYNSYGGESLYVSHNNEGRVRGYQVSFDRPYNSGAGTGSLFVHDIEIVRWLEASGYDVSYFTDVDRAANPNIMLGHRVYLDQGHDEYWSWQERDSVEAALAAGVNMIFLGGNESYWHIRLESSPIGPNRIITCYKDAELDPTPVAPGVTVLFRDPELDRPENILLGNAYTGYADDTFYRAPWIPYASPDRWYFDCTDLQAGDQVNNIVGEEWNASMNNGRGPGDLEIVSRGVVVDNGGTSTLQESVIYTATNGAEVFSAGTIHWSWGLIDHTYPNQIFAAYIESSDADHRIEQLTANLLDKFAGYWDGQPRACGPANQNFYDIGVRPTRTAWPMAPTATFTPSRTSTITPTFTRTPSPTRTPTFTRTLTPTRTPEGLGVIYGHLTWQGIPQPDARNVLTATLTLCSSTSDGSYLVTIDDTGNFTITTGMPDGSYTWIIKGVRNLANDGALTLLEGSASVEFGLARAGDANNSNIVNTSDFNLLKVFFGQSGDGLAADFDNDRFIDVVDFNLLKLTFGLGGAPLVCP